jgi:hypothetical protein
MQPVVRVKLHAAIYSALKEITDNNLLDFYRCIRLYF